MLEVKLKVAEVLKGQKMYFTNLLEDDKAFFIAEVGQNHQGDFNIASECIYKFSYAGANAVKFQMRDNKYLFDTVSYNKKYESENAFGNTYGEHREELELTRNEMLKLRELCAKLNIKFMCTPFDEPSLEFLASIETDILKVASFDLGNLSMLNKMAESNIPIIMSVGGGEKRHVDESVKFLKSKTDDLAVLHCVSLYPCPPERLNLDNIKLLKERYPDIVIGLSDHFNGTLSGPIGYEVGARIFEKHVTLNRAMKGTDHSFALEPRGFESFVRDIQRVPLMKKAAPAENLGEEPVFKKLGKSIAVSKSLSKGEVLSIDNLRGKIFDEPGLPVREMYKLIGKSLNKSIDKDEKVDLADVY